MQITWLIANGQLEPGDRLPTVRRLAEHLSINLHTVRSAYQKLEMQGLVETRRGQGTHVLSFDPRLVAQAASPLRSHTVGVVVAGWGNPFYHTFLRGVEEMAEEDQTFLILCTTHDDPGEAWRHFARLSAQQVDGILVVSHDISEFLPPESHLEPRGPASCSPCPGRPRQFSPSPTCWPLALCARSRSLAGVCRTTWRWWGLTMSLWRRW
jgi:hypothetical protein